MEGLAASIADRPRPPLSIAVATREGWRGIEACLESFRSDARAVGAELIVADGSSEPPPDAATTDEVVWIHHPGRSVFELYAAAFDRSTAPLVAMTEDHCRARPGWPQAILRAHRDEPAAAAIGGAIENGSTATLRDWASFLITQGPHMAPLPRRPRRISNESNLSVRRDALPRAADQRGRGVMLLVHLEQLRAGGALVVADDRYPVDHFQSFPLAETSAIHFHNGRSIAAYRGAGGARQWRRTLAWGWLPAYRSLRTVATVWRKRRHRRVAVASLPWIVWLEYCHAAGALMGALAGPGDSPEHLH